MDYKCSAWTPNGRCRNKAVTKDPDPGWRTGPLCRKHARITALEVVGANRRLVWALAHLGYLKCPDKEAA